MLPKKRKDWQQRLGAYLVGVIATPFEWGKHDCATMAADAIDVQCDTALGAQVRALGLTTERKMTQYVAQLGGWDLAVAEWLGTAQPPLLLKRGDITLYADLLGQPYGLAVHDGQQLVAPYEDGLRRIPLTQVLRGWRVG